MRKYRITIEVDSEEEIGNNINDICEAITSEDFRGAVTSHNIEEISKDRKEMINEALQGLSQQESYDFLKDYLKRFIEVYPTIKEEEK